MARLKQSFKNGTDSTQFINLELSTARFRLNPGEELILFYDSAVAVDDHGAALRVEFVYSIALELIVWTHEEQMFHPDGRPAEQDFDPL